MIRTGTESDLSTLRRIQSKTLAEPSPTLLETAASGYPPLFVVATPDPIAYAILVPGKAATAYLPELAVATDHQRQGHATRLIEHVSNQAARDGYTRLRLSVLASDDEARAFYSAAGFERIRRLPAEFERGDGILLEKSID